MIDIGVEIKEHVVRVVAPAVIERILADPKFHENLDERAAAHHANTHPQDREQNKQVVAILDQKAVVAAATEVQKATEAAALGILFAIYINTYFPHL